MPDAPATDPIGTSRWRVATAVSSVALAVILVGAAARDHFTEWRATQARHRELSTGEKIPLKIRQIWRPELGTIDRCATCHVATFDAPAIAGQPIFAEHPPMPHDPRELGCTVCHGGQGLATSAEAAHGRVKHWDSPMLAREQLEAGCGACHSHVAVPSSKLAAHGAELFAAYGCADCHKGARDLATVGLKDVAKDWHDRHMGLREGDFTFAPLADEDLPAMQAFLQTRIGAPKLMEGKQLAHELGCRGCHRVNGVGGDDGPEITETGAKGPAEFDYSRVPGISTPFEWHVAHIENPSKVVNGSLMPMLGVTPEQAKKLALYVMSLRPRPLPEALVTRDRLRVRLGAREFATDGRSLYAAFCSACHGPNGEGREFETLKGPFPALASAEFLALADDAFLRRSIHEGRPGRRMPAWGVKEGGLRAAEVDALVGHLRSLELPVPSFEEVMALASDAEAGRTRFAAECAPCHGAQGEGSPIAPALAARDNEVTTNDNRIYGTLAQGVQGTAMGSFRRFDAATMRAVIAAVRDLPRLDVVRKGWKPLPGDVARGREVFAANCEKCHGKAGEGDKGPALANRAFLATASDGYLAGTIIRGRGGTKMPAFGAKGAENEKLSPQQVADVVAFVGAFAQQPPPTPAVAGGGG